MTSLGDLTGRVFGRLTVIERAEDERNGSSRWRCTCSCGIVVEVRGANLVSGSVLSCGCLRADVQRVRAIERNRGAPRDRAGRLAARGTAKCPSCLRRRMVLARYGNEWICRWCANQRSIAAALRGAHE